MGFKHFAMRSGGSLRPIHHTLDHKTDSALHWAWRVSDMQFAPKEAP
jgi:hypothetical protein